MANDPIEISKIVRRRPKKLGADQDAGFEERQQMILRAAAKMFAHAGFAHTTIADIASEINVSKPAIYHYFVNKDALMRAILEEADRRYGKLLRDVDERADTSFDALKLTFMSFAQFAVTDFGKCVVTTDYQLLGAETRAFLTNMDAEGKIEIVRMMTEGVSDGSLRECNPQVFANMMSDLISAIAHRHFHDDKPRLERVLEQTWSVLAEGLAPRP